ncbi:hypothetical protein NQ318_001423 [Aromia moschata]|uniref:DNA polymerase alpha catalytic subunit n=1 Tax=Aromia moschata TaxID=1265417 RepID=A0AAV8YUY9_9CUCU|nr:hypothetical protein NQ318_001423 [Aromia moschata]
MSDSNDERRPKRSKRETSYRNKAFEKFRQFKSGNRNKYEIEELENVYETVSEQEYVKEVLSRQDDDWIVDDDGSGYVEGGRDIFDDDLDLESIAQATVKGKGTKRKKKAETKVEDDAILSEILAEIDEAPSTSGINPKPMSNSYSIMSRKLAAKNYMKNFSSAKPKLECSEKKPVKTVVLKEVQNKTLSDDDSYDIPQLEKEKSPEPQPENSNKTEEVSSQVSEDVIIESDFTQECFEDDIDMTQIEEFESQNLPDTSVDETNITDDLQAEFMSEWENIANEDNEVEVDTLLDKVFRFYWWDAYEDPEKQRGVVFLFGKTYCERTKSYISCCVAVRNIDRRLFVLPRPYMLNESGEPTDEPVTFKMVYNEVNENIIKPLQISSFRTRYVNKKYAFDPQIPTESDYMEIRYPKSFLLDRKIKGPCWLDISNPVPVTNPISWCKFEVNCQKVVDLKITLSEKPLPPPPLVVMAINLRSVINPKTLSNEVLMVSCLTHTKYAVDKQSPNPPFQQHFCGKFCLSYLNSDLYFNQKLLK